MEPTSPNTRVVPAASILERVVAERELLARVRPETQQAIHPPNPMMAGTDGSTLVDLGLRHYGVGIDCHSKFYQVCLYVREEDRFRQHEWTVDAEYLPMAACAAHVRALLVSRALLPPPPLDIPELTYTLESTGCYHVPFILAWKGSPCLVNPTLASAGRRKTDRLDARLLATHSIMSLWPQSFIADSQLQELRIMMRARASLQRSSTATINRVNNTLLRFGHTIGRHGSLASASLRPVIEDLCHARPLADAPGIAPSPLPTDTAVFILELYEAYDQFRAQLAATLKRALAYCKDHHWPTPAGSVDGATLLACLCTVPGVGPITALTWLAQVGDPSRFYSDKAAMAFSGFDPSLKISAGHVTAYARRHGNEEIHHAILQAAQVVVRRAGEPLGQWGKRLQQRDGRKGSWFRACSAVGRRLAGGLYWVHSKLEPFSYEKYHMEMPPVIDLPLLEMGLSPRVVAVCQALHLQRSADVATAWQTDLRRQPGVGPALMKEVREWLHRNRLRPAPPATPPSPPTETPSLPTPDRCP